MKRLLITFGCSWTYGIGVGHVSGMSKKEYEKVAWDPDLCNQYSFRGLLCKKFKLENKNFSLAGSSNQCQFRQAKIFFSSEEFNHLKSEFDQILVLWGITSTARNEFFNIQTQKLENFFYSHPWPVCQALTKFSYDHDNEVDLLSIEMHHWNNFFKNLQISNFWFDTFNHHNYRFPKHKVKQFQEKYQEHSGPSWPSWEQYQSNNYNIDSEIFKEISDRTKWEFSNAPINNLILEDKNPRDLMSIMAIKNGFSSYDHTYHLSDWVVDSPRVEFLVEAGLLNPISHHPTKKGHEQIAEIIDSHVASVM